MNVEDTDGLALQIVGRGDEQPAADASRDEQQPDAEAPHGGRASEAQETGGIGEGVHRRVPSSPSGRSRELLWVWPDGGMA